MIRIIVGVTALMAVSHLGWAQEAVRQEVAALPKEQTAIQQRLESYVEAFNKHDAAAVGKFWSPDGISVAEDSGQRIAGREALQKQFATFFEEAPGARLKGQITSISIVRPEVAMVEGQTTLFVAGSEPVVSTFSALLVKEGDEWLISHSHERDVPPPTSPQDALKDLEWLIGTWQDQSEDSQVITTVRWSPKRAFLVRSFTAQFADNELEGTQIIGWDPLNKQIRTWIFNSDGSFGQGTISKHDDDWLLKMWQILNDGRLAAATQVITRVDDDTMRVQVIGETVNGEPLPTSPPVTVIRAAGTKEAPTESGTGEEGAER
jgi:uncharacterized protein (TIGR02246 family)